MLNKYQTHQTQKTKKTKKETRGGAGRGQGRKSPFKEKTTGVKFTCPISAVKELKEHNNIKLVELIQRGL